jgi:hypothetical protein
LTRIHPALRKRVASRWHRRRPAVGEAWRPAVSSPGRRQNPQSMPTTKTLRGQGVRRRAPAFHQCTTELLADRDFLCCLAFTASSHGQCRLAHGFICAADLFADRLGGAVAHPASIRSITASESRSSAAKCARVASGTSCPTSSRGSGNAAATIVLAKQTVRRSFVRAPVLLRVFFARRASDGNATQNLTKTGTMSCERGRFLAKLH